MSRRAGYALLLAGAALAGLSCGGDITSPTTGNLEIITATSGPEPDADGYAVTIDDGTETAIAASGTIQRNNLEPGNHSVRLTGLAAHCQVAGENPRTVSISVGETARVDFAVSCGASTGAIEVSTVTAGRGSDPDGYSIHLDGGVDGPTIGLNARVTITPVSPGSHSVELGGLAPNCSVFDGNTSQTVDVAPGVTATVAFTITCGALLGSLRISTSTTGADLDSDGYAFAVDGGTNQPIGLSATTTLVNLPEGVHTATLSGLAANCTVDGENPRSIMVLFQQTAVVEFAVRCSALSNTYRATDLGTLGGASSVASDINSAGQVVGWSQWRPNGTNHAFLWENGVMTDIMMEQGNDSDGGAAAINSSGRVVGSMTGTGGGSHSFPWQWEHGTLTSLGSHGGYPAEINSAGQVAGCTEFEMFQCHAALWENGAMTDLGTLGGVESEAFGIDPGGRVVGRSERSTGSGHAFLWEKGAMIDLNIPGGESVAIGINAAGQVIGNVQVGGVTHGFLWEKGATTDLGEVRQLSDINSAGVVVGTRVVGGMEHAFVWERGSFTDLPGPSSASGINDEGQVVGTIRIAGADQRATLWTPE